MLTRLAGSQEEEVRTAATQALGMLGTLNA
jgi:hypothetical protein